MAELGQHGRSQEDRHHVRGRGAAVLHRGRPRGPGDPKPARRPEQRAGECRLLQPALHACTP
ncbi:MAG: hypothetical protein U5R31_16290 [Acidimicrobiia bacterium]|nr:hypothetical protein [Acidimicrobiia bacterium]